MPRKPKATPMKRGSVYSASKVVLGFSEFRRANHKRCVETWRELEDWSETDWMCAVAGEVGEAANLIKKRRRGEVIDKRLVADELADAVTYIDLLADSMGLDLAEALCRKFNAVSKRVGSDIVFRKEKDKRR